MKRIVCIEDLSCIGKCSLGVALPVLSAMGLECAMLPTALLSAHTAFDGFVCRETTELFAPILAHWQALGLRFDAIYTGFLASPAQIEAVLHFLDQFQTTENFCLIDPAMADQGQLYPGFSPDFPEHMRRLCSRADVITPNVTEACLLTGEAYRPLQDAAFVRRLLEGLLRLGVRAAVLTGIRDGSPRIGVAAMDAQGRLYDYTSAYLSAVCYGTGDLFAATCAGALTRGLPLPEAIALTADYVAETVRVTAANPDARWYGVDFETTLPYLITQLQSRRKEVPE